jgi:hypothetical protein
VTSLAPREVEKLGNGLGDDERAQAIVNRLRKPPKINATGHPIDSRRRIRSSVASQPPSRTPVASTHCTMLNAVEATTGKTGQVPLGADGNSSRFALSPNAQTRRQPPLVPGHTRRRTRAVTARYDSEADAELGRDALRWARPTISQPFAP